METTTHTGDRSLPIVESVRERDMDLLILEELYARTGFDALFLNAVGKPDFHFVRAYRSVMSSSLGETDIQIEFSNGAGKTLFILLENKVDADFQPNQYKRYIQRAELLITPDVLAEVVLVAPKDYIDAQDEFKMTVSYEAIMEWFKTKLPDTHRASYRAEIVRLAIEAERRGYQAIKDDLVTTLWKQYYFYLETRMPELNMKPPKAKPSSSSFLYLYPDWLPEESKLVHKMEKGYLDLELSGMADKQEALMHKYASVLPQGMELVVTGKSASFRFEVPPLSFEKSFDDQEHIVEEVIKQVTLLKAFILEHLSKGIL